MLIMEISIVRGSTEIIWVTKFMKSTQVNTGYSSHGVSGHSVFLGHLVTWAIKHMEMIMSMRFTDIYMRYKGQKCHRGYSGLRV